jgi:hypothetical protein
MILYHGTSVIIREADLNKSRKRTDFGRGFYLGDDLMWAGKWADTTVRRSGGTATVMQYELNAGAFTDDKLSFCKFDTPDENWLNFVRDNRIILNHTTPEPRHSFDLVYGRIADDGAADVVKSYSKGEISPQEAIERIRFLPRVSQLSLHTPLALSYLKTVSYSQREGSKWGQWQLMTV